LKCSRAAFLKNGFFLYRNNNFYTMSSVLKPLTYLERSELARLEKENLDGHPATQRRLASLKARENIPKPQAPAKVFTAGPQAVYSGSQTFSNTNEDLPYHPMDGCGAAMRKVLNL
jgi:hypothetical protein